MTAKERRAEKKRLQTAPLLTVYADALVEHEDGRHEVRPVRLWDHLPPWWPRSAEDQRLSWLAGFFEKQLKLPPTSKVLSVTCGRTAPKEIL
jgi:hypothetical protein